MATRLATPGWPALAHLPQPRHLYAWASGTRHYHFGCFEEREESLSRALDRTVLRHEAVLRSAGRLLDVGCGIGGACELLHGSGRQCVGIDPCGTCISFARANGPAGCRFEHASLSDLDHRHDSVYGAALLVEVGQYQPDLRSAFAHLARLLRPGGMLLVADVVARVPVDFAAVPFHRRGARRRIATATQLEVLLEEDLTAAVMPTFGKLRAALAGIAPSALRARPGRCTADERAELTAQCALLERGFRDGALAYEYLVLRRRAPTCR